MRGIRTAGAGLGLALATSVGLAQSPAARLGRIQPVDPPASAGEMVARGQAVRGCVPGRSHIFPADRLPIAPDP